MASRPPRAQTTILAAILAAVALASALAACGGEEELDPGNAEQAPDYAAMLEAAPPALAELYADGGALLPGGLEAYEQQIAALEGHPVVANVWASWCGPCRAEFPAFQEQAASRGDEVAFVGIDIEDSDDAARTFLDGHPVPYPSFSDPDGRIAAALGANIGTPSTVFYDAEGELTYVRTGPYEDEEQLAADIDRHALGGGS